MDKPQSIEGAEKVFNLDGSSQTSSAAQTVLLSAESTKDCSPPSPAAIEPNELAATMAFEPDTMILAPDGDPNATRLLPPPSDLAATLPLGSESAGAGPAVGDKSSGSPNAYIAGYQILEELGRGAMGVVYRARQVALNRVVAIKMILAGGHAGSEQLVRFHAEAEAVAKLQHPNIVQVYDIGEQDGLPYFSLEYVDGTGLDKQLGGKPQPPLKAAQMIETLARAMQFAHERGVVHRDLKPANVLVTKSGVLKVSDFGLAKQLDSDTSQTRTGTIMGTPSYMAPEQGRGEKHIGPLADVYALGSMLYEMVTGRPPFIAATALEMLMRLAKEEPVPPSRLQPGVSRDLETICLKCLQKDPHRRYASAGELADDLQRYQTGEPILARPVSGPERLWRWCRRNPRVAALSAAVALLLVTVATVSTVMAFRIQHEKNLAVGQRNRANDLAGKEATARSRADKNAEEANEARIQADKNADEANAAKKLAEENADAARKAQQEAELAQKKATENAKVASEQADLALNTLQSLIGKVQEQLQDAPATQQLKQDILLTAMGGIKQVAESAVKSGSTEKTMAAAHLKMGLIFKQLGQSEEAFKHFVRSYEIFQARLAAKPQSEAARGNLAAALTVLGDMSQELRRDVPASLKYYQLALEIREELQFNPTGNEALPRATVKQALAETYMRIGVPYLHLGEPNHALDYFQKALTLRRESAVALPNDVAVTQDMARSLMAIGEVNFRLENADVARQNYDEALGLRDKLLLRKTDYAPFKWELAATLGNFLEFDLRTRHIELARQHAPRYVTLMDELVQLDPRNADYQRHQALAYYRAATLAMLLKDNAEAERLNKECLAARERLVSASPNNDRRQMDLMLVLPRCGEHARAAKLAQTVRASQTIDREALVEVARALAQCAAAVADETLKTEYRRSAFDAIEKSIDQGYKDTVNLKTDPDLDALRDHPQFQELLAKVDQR